MYNTKIKFLMYSICHYLLCVAATLDRGIVISTEDRKPALFVISCGEGHLDLRTADKVMQSLLAKDSNQSGLPSPATIISEKNYIIVWEISS